MREGGNGQLVFCDQCRYWTGNKYFHDRHVTNGHPMPPRTWHLPEPLRSSFIGAFFSDSRPEEDENELAAVPRRGEDGTEEGAARGRPLSPAVVIVANGVGEIRASAGSEDRVDQFPSDEELNEDGLIASVMNYMIRLDGLRARWLAYIPEGATRTRVSNVVVGVLQNIVNASSSVVFYKCLAKVF